MESVNMANSLLEKIAEALTRDDSLDQANENVQFCVTDELVPGDINIEVDGLGQMTFPVSKAYIQQLISISSKAQFGLRDQTIFDENVRNTYEIKSDKLRITINEQFLTSMLSKMRDGLGLSGNSVLTAHLHNMLIYQPGQFFDMHQDSEKLENMVASLVVVLPSPHIGGDLIIEHGTKKHVFSSENIDHSNAKCIGFYADCLHEVEKIKHGHRIALTYNLVLKSGEISDIRNVNQGLTDAVKVYFDRKAEEQPQRLLYFLDHSYSENGLRWSMLKGTDRTNVSAFCGVAQELGLNRYLALAKIRESWSTEIEPCDPDPSIIEFSDGDVTLSYWIDSNNKKLPFSNCNIAEDEICWTRETQSFKPYNTEYEGYMGNYSSTKDFWYRRAAIVLWPESSQIQMNFMLNYDTALNEFLALTSSPGNEKKATEIIEKAGKHLYKKYCTMDKTNFEILANIALYIKNKDTALSILSHFQYEILNTDIIKILIELQVQYGITWCIELLNYWKNHDRYDKNYFIKETHSFVQNFLSNGGAASIVELLLEIQCNSLLDNHRETYKWLRFEQHKESLSNKITMCYQTLAACAAINNISMINKVVKHLMSNPESYPIVELAKLLFKLQDIVSSEYFSKFEVLRSYIVKSIERNLALGMRPNNDWSINATLSCKCKHCQVAMRFLHSKIETIRIWPIRENIRRHITNEINSLNLPVKLYVERTGSPYKLIMVKTEQLHLNAKIKYDSLIFYYQKLRTDIRN